jgi:hypothetical protein
MVYIFHTSKVPKRFLPSFLVSFPVNFACSSACVHLFHFPVSVP